MAIGKDKDDDDQLDGVAEGADSPDKDEDAATEKEGCAEKGVGKSRADTTKEDDADEDKSAGKKGKSSRK
jgi:hypothetical protein